MPEGVKIEYYIFIRNDYGISKRKQRNFHGDYGKDESSVTELYLEIEFYGKRRCEARTIA